MSVKIYKDFFQGLAEALDDVKKDGYWPTTFVSDASPELPLHWHDTEIHGYVLEGETWVRDGESGERLDFCVGDKLVLPAGAVHAEGETTGRMVYIVALPEPKPFHEFLKTYAPDDPTRPEPAGQ